MKIRNAYLLAIILMISYLSLSSCGTNTRESDASIDKDSSESHANSDTIKVQEKNSEIIIYYQNPSPLEMATLIRRSNSSFYKELLSPLENTERYTGNTKIALVLGIYGADWSYCKVFNQQQQSLLYISNIKKLIEKIGIAQIKSFVTYSKMEENIENSDSVLKVINRVFVETDQFLRKNDRVTTASLIVMGGWIEAMYIATNIYYKDPKNSNDILRRLVVQKFSLNKLAEILSKYQNDKELSEYFTDIIRLKNRFNNIRIAYNQAEVQIDSIKKVMTIKTEENIQISDTELRKIASDIKKIRNSILK